MPTAQLVFFVFMEGVLHTTLLTSALFISSLLPQASPSAALSPLPVIGQESFHAVKANETLSDIAKAEYGDETKVSVLVADNPWIQDPNYIEEGWQLKIRKNPFLNDSELPSGTISAMVASSETTPTPEVSPAVPQDTRTPTEAVSPQPTAEDLSTPTPTDPAPTTPPVTPASSYTGGPLTSDQIQFLGNCESGMTATRNSGNGFYGAFQFSLGTWNNMGTGYARADLAPLDVQIDAVQRLLSRSSIWTQFPGCALRMRSAGLL